MVDARLLIDDRDVAGGKWRVWLGGDGWSLSILAVEWIIKNHCVPQLITNSKFIANR